MCDDEKPGESCGATPAPTTEPEPEEAEAGLEPLSACCKAHVRSYQTTTECVLLTGLTVDPKTGAVLTYSTKEETEYGIEQDAFCSECLQPIDFEKGDMLFPTLGGDAGVATPAPESRAQALKFR